MTKTRLSESEIWSIMADYYNYMGPKAWKEGIVPSDISSNKYLANIYAELILATLKDWKNNQNSKDPIYIVEVGAGHGKLSFYILKLLEEYSKRHGENYFKDIKYIITDISSKNMELWKNHPALQHFVNIGVLDFAVFDAHSDNEIELTLSKKKIFKNSLKSPLVAICNYLFDTIPQDAFQIKNGELYESLIEVSSKNKKEKQFFENLKYNFSHTKTKNNYYKWKSLNKVLREYCEHFKEASFLVPISGIGFIKNLETFTKEYFVLLIADKAISDIEELEGLENPEISLHGSVSLMVNFDIIKRFIEYNTGTSLMMPNKHSDFQVGCFINKSIDIPNLKNTFYSRLADFSPQDLFNLCYNEDDDLNPGINSIDTIISILQLSKWDPGIFMVLNPELVAAIEAEGEDNEIYLQQDKIIIDGAKKVWDYFYMLESDNDFAFELGTLYYALEYFDDAVESFKNSITFNGEQAEVFYNLALCYQALENDKLAIQYCNKTLELDSEYDQAKKMLKEYK